MVDLLDFYRRNYDPKSYYSKFHNQLTKISDESFVYIDDQEIVDRFRGVCEPTNTEYEKTNSEFLLLCFWLNKNGYMIKEFPNLLSRPSSLFGFAYEDIRKYIIKHNRDDNGTVRWQERRSVCSSMSITTNIKFQLLPDDIENKIRLISTRKAKFDSMTVDEQLQNLNNLIENLLKPKSNGKYISVDYDKIFFGYMSENQVKEYRNRTQPFRHATEDTLLQRRAFSEEEKKLLSELGIFIAIHIHNFLASVSKPNSLNS